MKLTLTKIFFIITILLFTTNNYLFADVVDENAWMSNNSTFERKIYIKKGMVTTIQFSSMIKYLVIGDELIAEEKAINDNTILLSAKLPNEQTNLNVTTADGNFVFVIETLNYKDKKEPNLHINVGKLASATLVALEKKIHKERDAIKFNPNYDYHFSMYIKPPFFLQTITKIKCFLFGCKYEAIAPRNVWTDGKYTYLDYRTTDGSLRNFPVVQEVVDGIDVPINQFAKKDEKMVGETEDTLDTNGILVIHTLSKKLTLVSNGVYLCIEYTGNKYEIH